MRRHLLVPFLALALASPPAVALSTAQAAPAGISVSDKAAMQQALQQLVDQGIVGVTAQVSGPSGTWKSSAGRTNLTASAKTTLPTDRMRIGSVSKTMVATVAMQMVQEGRWTLGTTVDEVLPGLLPGHGSVTVDQLLSHRSGIPDSIDMFMQGVSTPADLVANLSRPRTDRQILDWALQWGWNFTPGTSFAYSNTGYLVIGMMLERTTGQSLGTLLQERVFTPAGMVHSSYNLGRLTGRQLTENFTYDNRLYSLATAVGQNYGPGGAVVASTPDLDRFLDALMRGRLLRQDLVDQMIRPRSSGWAYGLGIYNDADACGSAMYGHDGRTYGARALTFSSRDGSRQIVMEMNVRDLNNPTRELSAEPFLQIARRAVC